MLQMGYRPQLRMPPPQPGQMMMMMQGAEVGFDGKMLRKSMARKTVDYHPSVVKYLEDRVWKKHNRDERYLQPDPLYTQLLTLPQDMIDNPVSCATTRFIRAALNKDPRPIFCVCWTPDGRRLITGASSGEFTLWNGLTFNFETILQAHNSAVRSMIWSRNEQWMLTGDDKGYVKYWQANMNNVKMFQGHFEAIRGLSFSPTDSKFTSCSDDRTVRIFDFVTATEESVLQGHGSDVKCVDWHPFKALIVSGSKDSQQPIILWDAKNAKKITTIHAHKNTCTDLKWNQFNGNWLISSSRDHLCKLFDIRNLKEEVQSFRGHKKDACTVSWHPIHEKLFASGGADGSIFFWLVNAEKELGSLEDAHESIVWDLSWHPLGHMLVSGSNDRSTRFWTRNRPGDPAIEKTDELSLPKAERATGIIFKNIELTENDKETEGTLTLPGLGLEKDMIDLLNDDFKDDSPNSSMNNLNMISPSGIKSQQNQQNYQNQMQQQQLQSQTMNRRNNDNQISSSNYDYDDDESRRRKAPYSKPIPKEFEKAWKSAQSNMTTTIPSNISNIQSNSNIQNQNNSNNVKSSTSQPIKLMDLMSTTIDPPPVIQQNSHKRKLSQDQTNDSNNFDQDDRFNNNRGLLNKNKQFNNNQRSNFNNNSNENQDDMNDDSNDNNQQQFNNNSNFRRGGGNQNRRNYNNNNSNLNNGGVTFRFQSVKDQANKQNNSNNNNENSNQFNSNNNKSNQNQNDDDNNANFNKNNNDENSNNSSNFNRGRGGGMMNRGGGGGLSRGGNRGGFANKNRFNNNSNSNTNSNNNN